MPTRVTGLNVNVFTVNGTSLITALQDVTLHRETKSEDGSGIQDQTEYAWATKNNWHMDVDTFAETTAALMAFEGQSVALVWNSGAGTYTGQALVAMASHNAKDGSLQKVKATFKAQGDIVLS